MKLRELGDAYERLQLGAALESAATCAPDLIPRVQHLRPTAIPVAQRATLAGGLYCLGKKAIGGNNFDQALTAFRLAHNLVPNRLLFQDRAKLLESAIGERKLVPWRGSLISLQRKLGIVCTKKSCTCTSHAQIARCRGLLRPLQDERDGITIYTLAPYYSRWMGDHWTRLLKAVKKQFQADLLEPIADIGADFLIESTDVLKHLDVVVPIPPSIEKFGARGFAPNDIVARRIGARLAMPFISVLCRTQGPGTRKATAEELEAEFKVSASGQYGVSGLGVLLIEDIWTWGRTIPICARKLVNEGARSVVALALGKTEG
jgi:predicted amidophosphoribosyltransferase